MHAQHELDGSSSLLKGLFILVSLLVLAALGYAGWIVVAYWDRVGV
ncbi:MAG: hypothetical protein ACN0LA_09570 [Candidatus Longimicrobiales bacterium M2_2A_002]